MYQTDYWNGKPGILALYEDRTCIVRLIEAESDKRTCKKIDELNILTLMDYEYAEGVTVSKHEAKIMQDGVVLHGAFLKIVSD